MEKSVPGSFVDDAARLGVIARQLGLSSALDQLFSEQKAIGFIGQDVLDACQKILKVQSKVNRKFFYLQNNAMRRNRGLSEKIHPRPRHKIPYREGVPCFLCQSVIQFQWPNERGFLAKIKRRTWQFFPNPAPVFDQHFTVVSPRHLPQRMSLAALVALSRELPGRWCVQNGEGAGATNPWHLHIQIFSGELPMASVPGDLVEGPDIWRITRLQLPLPVYCFELTVGGVAALELLLKKFESEDPNFRLNILVQYRGPLTAVYVVIRDIRCRTMLYRKGQPGYAEVAGVISAIDEAGFETWVRVGYAGYEAMLEELHSTVAEDSFTRLLREC